MNTELPYSTKIIFDTNVLIAVFAHAGFTPSQVYQHCVERYEVYTSEWLLDEVREVLSRKKFKLPQEDQDEAWQQVKADAILVHPTNDLPTDSPDPDDNNVLRAALFVKADFLITGDAKHLLPLKQVGSTQIISPREFYEWYIA